MSDMILYGGTFNPPTIAHYAVIKYLLAEYRDLPIIVLPTNDFYKANEVVSYAHRLRMVTLMCQEFTGRVSISEYERDHEKYEGTYLTLRHFNHPYFVIGADELKLIKTWINYELLIKENKFIVIPRGNIDAAKIIEKDEYLSSYKNHFHVLGGFPCIDVSSSDFRSSLDEMLLVKSVAQYIKENNLYRE